MDKQEYLRHQFEISKMRAMKSHAELVSGAFRQRKIFHGTSGPELSDDEKAQTVAETMGRHIQFMQELLDEMEVTL